VSLHEPRLEVTGVFGEELVAEVIGEPPPPLAESSGDLRAERPDHRIVDRRWLFAPNDLTKYRCHHRRDSI
jgi:hypothetical protein